MSTNNKCTHNNAEQNIDLWKNTTYKSSLYDEMHYIRNITKHSGKYRKEFQIKEMLEKSSKESDIDKLLLYLNEYEIIYGTENNTYNYYENLVLNKYNDKLKSVNRPNCKLLDENINNKNINYFKNLYKGERCFIIGNGPSLNKIDLTKLKNEITFGVNSIFLNYDKMGFYPTYYTVEDSHVIRERSEAIKGITGSIKFIPRYAYNIFGTRDDFIYLNIILDYRRYKGFPYFSTDISRRIWVGGTVSYINLQLAYYMGFKDIYLIGFDHNYIIPKSANVVGADIISTDDDPNHFHPDYFGKGFSWHVPLTERMELCYLKAKYAFEQSEKKIINATSGGSLEIFPRIDYEKLFIASKTNNKNIMTKLEEKKFDITVIIPAYNAEDTLVKTIESVLNQKNIYPEILIINDGSTDNTYNIAKEYADKFKNIKLIDQENMGLGGARNTGIANATSPYITFLDADDTFNRDILSISLSIQKQNDYDIIQFDFARIDKDGNDIKKTGSGAAILCGIDGVLDIIDSRPFAAWARIYKKDLLINNNIKFPDRIYHEDIVFTLKAYFYAKKVFYINKKGYNWICRDGSITSDITNFHIDSMKTNIINFKNFLQQESLYEILYRRYLVFSYRMISMVLGRAYYVHDIYKRTLLLRHIRHTLEELNLDFYELVQIAASNNKKYVFPVFEKLFYYRYITPQTTSQVQLVNKQSISQQKTTTAATTNNTSSSKSVSSNQSKIIDHQSKQPDKIIFHYGILYDILRIFIRNKAKRKKFDRDPYKFFEDAKAPFCFIKYLFSRS